MSAQEKNMEAAEGSVATEAPKPEVTVVGGKSKKEKSGNLIMDIAHEVEGLSKAKAINEAAKLAENIELNYFKLGGVLKVINENSWFEGFASFDQMVFEQFGFQSRKARYLISIYENLVTKQIPWEKVGHLGWTKLKDLAPVLTLDNVDQWVEKAEKVTVAELQAMLKAGSGEGKETTAKTTDDVVKMNFKLKPDQADVVQQALAKAKGELHTDYDTVAIENICSGYLGGVTSAAGAYDLDEVIKNTGFEPLLHRICELFPEFDVSVAPAETGAAES